MMDWQSKGNDGVYTDGEAETRLRGELPGWYLENGCICRKYRTGGWKSSLMVTNVIGHLAESAFHHPDLALSYGLVTVRLNTHSANGVTNKDFELAKKIEAVVMWQPALEGGAFEGVPDDARFQYLKYD